MRMALFFLLQHLQAPSVCGMAIPIVVLVAYVGKIMSVWCSFFVRRQPCRAFVCKRAHAVVLYVCSAIDNMADMFRIARCQSWTAIYIWKKKKNIEKAKIIVTRHVNTIDGHVWFHSPHTDSHVAAARRPLRHMYTECRMPMILLSRQWWGCCFFFRCLTCINIELIWRNLNILTFYYLPVSFTFTRMNAMATMSGIKDRIWREK